MVAAVQVLDVRPNRRSIDADFQPVQRIVIRDGVDAEPDRARQPLADAVDLSTGALPNPRKAIFRVMEARFAGNLRYRCAGPKNHAQYRSWVPIGLPRAKARKIVK